LLCKKTLLFSDTNVVDTFVTVRSLYTSNRAWGPDIP